jgi:hypothetical protein
MIVSIHQPHFLPWMGYWNKVLRSDAFVWLHSVQYRKNYFQNRTKIKDGGDREFWLTVPVHAASDTPIDRVTVADAKWLERVEKSVTQSYSRKPYFAQCWPPLRDALRSAGERLEDINLLSFSALLDLLGAGPRIVRDADLGPLPEDPTDRLVAACRALGATQYIAGRGGRNYLRTEAFERAGFGVLWQDFSPDRVRYDQGAGTFIGGLSIIDCLFNVGPSGARELALSAWAPEEVSP